MNPAILAMDDSSQSESEWNILTPQSASDLPDTREKVIVSVDDNVPASQRTEVGDLGKECTAPPTPAINLRAYQQEMLNQSLKQNVIVAMDTGSGKTQVAILRIRAELEKSSPGKIIWFMAPTVSLCAQQYDSISRQIRSAKIRLLTGNLNLHTWQPSTWDVILNDVQVVISTFQILLDALEHAFIKMNRLSLLVFDEAHHCVKKHAGSKIMKDYYLRDKNDGVCVPSILGLTASPSMRSDKQGLLMLEATMDARCISPTIHREELIKHANRPQISRIEYSPPVDAILTHSMRSLQSVYHGLDIEDDPHVTYLRREPDEKYLRRAQTAIEKKDTFCQNQLKGLSGRALELSSALGPWAADRYLWKAIDSFLSRIGTSHAFFDQWMNEEKRYLSRVLQEVAVGSPPVAPQNESVLSEKVKLLAAELIQAQGEVLGIVFVKERATVTMLMEVLNTFGPIRQRFRIGAVVGDSNFAGRKKDVYDFAADMDSEVLQKFRAGTINLLIATSVLEEGIDVPACNLVICFDQPATPKSFIQRRGRARMQDSRFVLFFERQKSNIDKWLNLEEEMKKFYQDEQREAQRLAELEEAEGPGISSFVVKSTGATLNFDNAKQLLEHFCSKLFRGEFVDNRPDYIIEKYEGDDPCRPRLRATVILPSHLPVGLRKAHGASIWFSEKNATKDVAFHAYLTLYKAGFVNDHLLPFEPGEFSRFDRRPATVEAYAQLDPWAGVARSWKQAGMKWIYELSHYDGGGNELGQYQVLIPEKVGLPEPMQLYLDHAATSKICFTSVHEATIAEESTFRDDTSTLLALHYSHRWDVENRDHVVKIKALGHTLDRKQMGADGFDETNEDVRNGQYLIRDHFGTPYTFESIIPSKPPIEEVQKPFRFYADAPEDVPYLVLKKWTRRSDFFHPVVEGQAEPCATKPYGWVVPMAWARVDKMPAKLAAFGMLIPHVIHEFEVMLLTKRLINTALKPLQITNHGLVREAISSRSARGPCDYERLELLGDSLLKYCTAVHVFTEYTHWHEGYLSFKKDSIVSNAKLCQDSINSGLAKFIISQAFTGQKWRPLHLDSFTQPKGSRLAERLLSTKTLADVVEALIGAAHVEGGMEKALDCISLFIRDVNWQDMKLRGKSVNDGFSEDAGLPQDLAPVEDLLGYTFKKKDLLVEAMTHASYMSDTDHRSLDRLEFLGDAVLDYVVVTKLFSVKPALQNHHMHLLKTATVNGEFLAFINLEHGLRRKEAVVTIENEISTMDKKLSLWQFMRHGSSAIGVEQDGAVKRHDLLRNDIATALMTGRRYPWALLARLRPRKFFSDMIEALLGAVWIDSGCLLQCEKTLDHLGIMAYLNRFIQDNVHIMHPKEELVVLAGDETVTYDIHIHNKTGEVDNEAEYSCRVLVGDRLIAEVDGGISNYEVQVKAAEEAVRVLTEETQSSAMDLS